jgi:predicted amidohydrolase YtcJ
MTSAMGGGRPLDSRFSLACSRVMSTAGGRLAGSRWVRGTGEVPVTSSFLLRGGGVCTMDPARPWAQSAVVRGDTITYVGPLADAADHTDRATEAIDLDGRLCLPGFIDGHNHLVMGGLTKLGVSVRGLTGRGPILERVAGWIATQESDRPLRGHGWLPDSFPERSPRREWLDEVTGDRPMALLSEGADDIWFNTAAMRAAGIGAGTPDPVPGAQYYRRDPDGTPTGHGVDLAGAGPLGDVLGYNSPAALTEAMAAGLLAAPSWGITSYLDAGIILGDACELAEPVLASLASLDRAGELPVRLTGSVWTRSPASDPADVISLLADWNRRFRSPHLSVSVCKIFADGTLMSGGALLLEPFASDPGDRGSMTLTAEQLAAQVQAAQRAGFDAHIHVEADGTARAALDAIEEVQRRLGRPARHTLAHNTLVHPDDVRRYAALNVIASVTPLWGTDYNGTSIDTYIKLIGPERVHERLFPNLDLLRAGATLTFGADVPGVDVDESAPLIQLEAAVTRKRPGHPDDRPLSPHQRLPLADALHAYTVNGAYALRMEHQIGSIEPGKKADLVVLGADLFTIPPDQIHTVPVMLTMMDGQITHAARGC